MDSSIPRCRRNRLSLRVPRLGLGPANLSDFLDSLVYPPDHANNQRGSQPREPRKDKDPVTTDGDAVRRMLELVTPAIGFNPRRIKQFLNLFRFRYVVAWETRQLRSQHRIGWTIPQLGKVVAIEMLRPELLDSLLVRPHDLTELAAQGSTPVGDGTVSARWRDDRILMDLIRSSPEGGGADYELSSVPLLLHWLYGAGGWPSEEKESAS